MSGRLVISTKKSYCPWLAANVSKYEKAEERHRKQQEEEEANTKHVASRSRWNVLRHEKEENKQGGHATASHSGHIHLFPHPVSDAKDNKPGDVVTRNQSPKQKVPFYLSSQTEFTSHVGKDKIGGAGNHEYWRLQHDRLDPMRPFSSSSHPLSDRRHLHDESFHHNQGLPQEKKLRHHHHKESEKKSRKRPRSSFSDENSNTSSDDSSRSRKKRKRSHKEKQLYRSNNKKNLKKQQRKNGDNEHGGADASSLAELRCRRLEREAREQERQRQALRNNNI